MKIRISTEDGYKVREAYQSETGAFWWVEGHVSPPEMLLAAIVEMLVEAGSDSAMDVLVVCRHIPPTRPGGAGRAFADMTETLNRFNDLMSTVEHVWMKVSPDDEWMEPASPRDPEALPFTTMKAD